jgi:hypothetical protein
MLACGLVGPGFESWCGNKKSLVFPSSLPMSVQKAIRSCILVIAMLAIFPNYGWKNWKKS